jgi:CheY-like chemotaxis protein
MSNVGRNNMDLKRKNICFVKTKGASAYMMRIIDDILDMSAMQADKLSSTPVPFTFVKMLQIVVDVIRFQADEKFQRLIVSSDVNISSTLIGDERRLGQVISRLLGCLWIKTIPIAALTTDVYEENVEKCLACGINDHIGKPIGYGILMEKPQSIWAVRRDHLDMVP